VEGHLPVHWHRPPQAIHRYWPSWSQSACQAGHADGEQVTIKNAGRHSYIRPCPGGSGKGMMDCVGAGTLPEDLAEDLFIIVSVFIEWDAKDKKKVYEYNYQATKLAIERAISREPKTSRYWPGEDRQSIPSPEQRISAKSSGGDRVRGRCSEPCRSDSERQC